MSRLAANDSREPSEGTWFSTFPIEMLIPRPGPLSRSGRYRRIASAADEMWPGSAVTASSWSPSKRSESYAGRSVRWGYRFVRPQVALEWAGEPSRSRSRAPEPRLSWALAMELAETAHKG